jgi:hypothetical protein
VVVLTGLTCFAAIHSVPLPEAQQKSMEGSTTFA